MNNARITVMLACLAAGLLACPSGPGGEDDAGTRQDAGQRPVDAGQMTRDAGHMDAGQQADAGQSDAGPGVDAGVDAGNRPNVAEGTLGFDAVSSVVIETDVFGSPLALVYMMSPDDSARVCALEEQSTPFTRFGLFLIPLQDDGGVPLGELSFEDGDAMLDRYDTDDAGDPLDPVYNAGGGTMEVFRSDAGGYVGTYSATFPLDDGGTGTMQGRFDAPLCP